MDLAKLYASARCLKDEVYRQWLDNLTRHALSGDNTQRDEALRRMDYIENNLLARQAH